MSRTFTLAVERVADDRRFADRFRQDPARALRRYRLDADQIDAIKSGDHAALREQGFDIDRFQNGKRHGLRPYVRRVAVGATVLGAVFGLTASPATAADEFCKIDCPGGPRLVLTGLRRADGRASIRLGRHLVSRTSMLRALRRAGARMDGARALGARAVRAQLRALCDDKSCVGLLEDAGPILIAAEE